MPGSTRAFQHMLTIAGRGNRSQRLAWCGVMMLALALGLALGAPWLAPYPPNANLAATMTDIFAPPSARHWLGTDDAGGDVLSNGLYGARVSLLVGFSAALIAVCVGSAVGLVAGFRGGRLEALLLRFTDIMLVIPDLPLAIVLVALTKPGLGNLIIVIALVGWSGTARVVHAQTLALRKRTFVLRARVLGASTGRILGVHLLPLLLPLIAAKSVFAVSLAILNESALSFLGLADPSAPSWGQMLNFAFNRGALSAGAWWALLPPGLGIAWVVLGCAALGHGLEKRLNPRLESHHLAVSAVTKPAPAGPSTEADGALLAVRDLAVSFAEPGLSSHAVLRGISFDLRPGEILGIVGESGSGKSTLLLSLLQLLPASAYIDNGSVQYRGRELIGSSAAELRALRGGEIAWVPQGAMTAFNPVRTVGAQIAEAIRQHRPELDKAARAQRVGELLALVGLTPARQHHYPHQYSGGMRQRALLAMALAANPRVVLADEPTTALDVLSRAELLNLLHRLRRQLGLALVVVTHDVAVVAELCDTVLVLQGGRGVEYGPNPYLAHER